FIGPRLCMLASLATPVTAAKRKLLPPRSATGRATGVTGVPGGDYHSRSYARRCLPEAGCRSPPPQKVPHPQPNLLLGGHREFPAGGIEVVHSRPRNDLRHETRFVGVVARRHHAQRLAENLIAFPGSDPIDEDPGR